MRCFLKKDFITSDEVLSRYGTSNVYHASYNDPFILRLQSDGFRARYFNASKCCGFQYDVYDLFDKTSGKRVAVVCGSYIPDKLMCSVVKNNVSAISAHEFK